MPDVLEGASRSVDLEQGDFERLLDRRERTQRNRRIRAGALGVLVALVTGAILARSLLPDSVPVDPRPTPAAAGTLAYTAGGDIYLADQDGSNPIRIANGLPEQDCTGRSVGTVYGAEGPMWSPDGRYLAYQYSDCSDPDFPGGVEISDAEGNVVASFPAEGWEIAWSPDSTRVAVWDHFSFDESPTIGIYGLDGARQTQVTTAGFLSGDHDPKWMPDGTSVWVENYESPLDGSAPRLLPFGDDPYATFSPDGSLVAYNTNGSLMVARSDGSEPREVFDRQGGGSNWGKAWSPTGDRIAFAADGDGNRYGAELHVVDVATGAATLLAEAERGTSFEAIGFSPQGDRILFRKNEGDTNSLWSIGVDGSDPRLVVAGTWQGQWSP